MNYGSEEARQGMLTACNCPRKRHRKDNNININTMNVEINETDIISQLPQYIIQQIASFLPTIEVGSTSVVPKAWHHIWIHCPFSQSLFGLEMFAFPGTYEVNNRTGKFLNFLHNSLVRQCL